MNNKEGFILTTKKYVSPTRLSSFFEKLQDVFSPISHSHAIKDVTNLQTTLDGKVPTSRTINGNKLTSNITLTAEDIGADEQGSATSALNSAMKYTDDCFDEKFESQGSGDTVTWDGDTSGRTSVIIDSSGDSSYGYYHIADCTLSISDLQNGATLLAYYAGESVEETVEAGDDSWFDVEEDGAIGISAISVYIPYNGYTIDSLTFPKKGLYSLRIVTDGEAILYLSSLQINGYSGFADGCYLKEEYLSILKTGSGSGYSGVSETKDTITWNGDTSGKEVVDCNTSSENYDLYLYKVSGTTLTTEDIEDKSNIALGVTVCQSDGEIESVTFDFGDESISDYGYIYKPEDVEIVLIGYLDYFFVCIVLEDITSSNDTGDSATLTKGIYMSYMVDNSGAYAYVSSLSIAGFSGFNSASNESNLIKEEYLPIFENNGGKSDTLTWDGNTDGLETITLDASKGEAFYHVSDEVLTISDLASGGTLSAASSDGTQNTGSWAQDDIISYDDGLIVAGALVISIPADNFSTEHIKINGEGVTFTKKGVWFLKTNDWYISSFQVNDYYGFGDDGYVIKEEYLPESLFNTEHNHDERYYTESEVDAKVVDLNSSIQTQLNTKLAISVTDTALETAYSSLSAI